MNEKRFQIEIMYYGNTDIRAVIDVTMRDPGIVMAEPSYYSGSWETGSLLEDVDTDRVPLPLRQMTQTVVLGVLFDSDDDDMEKENGEAN